MHFERVAFAELGLEMLRSANALSSQTHNEKANRIQIGERGDSKFITSLTQSTSILNTISIQKSHTISTIFTHAPASRHCT